MASYTAITHVNGHNIVRGNYETNVWKIPQPSSMEVEIQDVSSSDAGRTADTIMHKKSLRTIYALSLSWNGLPTAQAKRVLQRFNEAEYFDVTFLDPYTGQMRTKNFYVGNRTVPMYSAVLDIWSNVSFKIIER